MNRPEWQAGAWACALPRGEDVPLCARQALLTLGLSAASSEELRTQELHRKLQLQLSVAEGQQC